MAWYRPSLDKIKKLAIHGDIWQLEQLQREKENDKLDAMTLLVDRIDYARPLKVISYPDSRLRLPNAKIRLPAKGINDLAKDMFNIMYKDDGIGLAAPQVGVNIQMMVFNPEGVDYRGDKSHEVVLINPRISKTGRETVMMSEGCLSFATPVVIRGDIERVESISIKAMDLSGNKVKLDLAGLPARIFLHEFDHLNGTLFFERMTPEVLETVRDDLKQYEEEFIARNPDVDIQRSFK